MMVEHFLRVCHDLTLKYWSKDGSNVARKALKENLHHVGKVLQICEEALIETNPIPAIVDILVESQIYQSSSRFFTILFCTFYLRHWSENSWNVVLNWQWNRKNYRKVKL